MTVRVAIAGAGGRMGQALIEAALDAGDLELTGALDVAASPSIGSDAGERFGRSTGIRVACDVDAVARASDVLIDFTRPSGTLVHLAACARAGVAAVVGTTGFDDAGKADIAAHARVIPIVFAPNMSVGVNVLAELVERAARLLGPSFDIEIVEMHHRDKVDAPSGTALMLGAAAAEGRAIDLAQRSVKARDGVTGPRHRGDIGFATLRGGSVVGEHKVIFAGAGERVELVHVASDRSVFARGAVKAMQWGQGKAPGLYSMTDVLGL
jgi:4-hydroxy-tetrahydrodipicolinate reductase